MIRKEFLKNKKIENFLKFILNLIRPASLTIFDDPARIAKELKLFGPARHASARFKKSRPEPGPTRPAFGPAR